jgi:hypothetical protein
MKKILIIMFLCLVFCNAGFAQTYYFKNCKLSEAVSGDYLIDLKTNTIKVTLKSIDGTVQEFIDKIKLVTKDRILSEIIQQKNKKFATQYFLDSNSKSVIRQLFKREIELDLVRPEGPRKIGYCANVKSDWYKSKEEIKEEKENEKINLLEQKLKKISSLSKCEGTDSKKWTSCQGTYVGRDKYIYVGEWKNGEQSGKGIELWGDGKKYIGEFKNDKKHGSGTFSYADGTKFIGDYKNGKKDGQGTLIWLNKDKYVGKFKNGKANGKGIYTFASGTIFSGQFKNGFMFIGVASYPEGGEYVGEFKFDKPHGQGTFTYSNGGKYIGQFVDGYEYGEGVCVKPNGTSAKCEMKNRDVYLGKNKYNISIIGNWHELEERLKSKQILSDDFNSKASEYCLLTGTGNYKELEKKIKVQEIDKTPAFGLEPVYKLKIDGTIECQ